MKQDWKVNDLLDWTRDYFNNREIEEPRLEAEVLLAFVLGLDRVGLYTNYDRPVNEDERARFREIVKRRAQGEPTSYIVNQREFMSLSFYVDKRVLVPRPDTETLVEEAIRLLKPVDGEVLAADVGTGSGAIAISLAHYNPRAIVSAIDVDEGALQVAVHNAGLNGVESRISFSQGYLLQPVMGKKFHLIAANLPYIPSDELSKLPKEVIEHEPTTALDGGPDGLSLYRILWPQAIECLVDGGYILMEIAGQRQAELLVEEIREAMSTYIINDLGGRARVVVARKEAVNEYPVL